MCANEFETKEKQKLTKIKKTNFNIQLFRERLSEKVHATIPKGIVGGFEFTVIQRSLKELHKRRKYVCRC